MASVTKLRLATDAPAKRAKAAKPKSFLAMVRTTGRPENRLAACVGALVGGFVPVASYSLAHFELAARWWFDPKVVLVAGGLLYSAKTVIQLARKIFAGDWIKAIGFCVLLEGVMVFSQQQSLAVSALAILIGMNAIGTAMPLVSQDNND